MTLKFQPTASLVRLYRRAEIIRRIRSYFDNLGFLEVQTPVLSHDTVIDHYVEPIPVEVDWGQGNETLYLQTSPEFGMKRLVTAGLEQIYQIIPVFRRGDRGQHHNLEFTMLEWYRTHDTYREGRDFLAQLIISILGCKTVQQIPFGEIFELKTGLNPHQCGSSDYRRYADQNSISWPNSFLDPKDPASSDDWMDLIFSEKVQPSLGKEEPIILYDYPGSQSQLAQSRIETLVDGSKVEIAERFELFINGLELANGYHELCDPNVLRRRNEITFEARIRSGKPQLPMESRLLAAMENGFPPCCGCALGIDRLLMVILKTDTIDDVIAFPVEIA